MPVLAYAHATGEAARAAGSGKVRGVHLVVVLGLGVAAVLLFAAGLRAAPGGVKVPARMDEDFPQFLPPPGAPVVGPDEHVGPVTFSVHRYPHTVGHEISALINFGHATLRLPHSRDMDWLACPPSEATL